MTRVRLLRWVMAGAAGVAGAGLLAAAAREYPLDGYERTGIRRLRAYQLVLERKLPGNLRLPPGAMLPESGIRLRLRGVNDTLDLGPDTPRDSALQAGLERAIGSRDDSYRVALLDITDPARPRFAGVRPDEGYIPGSVGKLLVLTGAFNELRRLYPEDVEARERMLRERHVVADRFVLPNSHQVPVVADGLRGVTHRAIRVGDTFSLWEWVDHMVSPSSNAAASMVWKEALLMRAFGPAYPPSPAAADSFLRSTRPLELSDRSVEVLEEPLAAVGLDTERLRQRTYFTGTASRSIPGKSSLATPLQLLRWLVRLEQGKLVDGWSSQEMKRLLYFTRRRYRYSASPALNEAAVYFKSGSLYQCEPEPGYACGQYRGNKMNLMHSVAIIESPAAGERQRVYLVAMMSNVLKINSAAEHLAIATRIERMIASLHPEPSPGEH